MYVLDMHMIICQEDLTTAGFIKHILKIRVPTYKANYLLSYLFLSQRAIEKKTPIFYLSPIKASGKGTPGANAMSNVDGAIRGNEQRYCQASQRWILVCISLASTLS